MNESTTIKQVADTEGTGGLMTVQDVARLLRCSVRHVYRLSDAALMPRPVRLGALVRWKRSGGGPTQSVQDWIDAGCPSCRGGSR